MTEQLKNRRCLACDGIGILPDGDGQRKPCTLCRGTGHADASSAALLASGEPIVVAGAHGVTAELTSSDLALIEQFNSLPLRKRLVLKGMILA